MIIIHIPCFDHTTDQLPLMESDRWPDSWSSATVTLSLWLRRLSVACPCLGPCLVFVVYSLTMLSLSLSSSHRSIDRSIFIDVYVDTSVQPSKCSWSLRGSSLSPHVQANSLNQLPVGGSAQDWQWDALDQCEAVEKFAFWILQPSTIIPSTSGGPRLFYDILGLSLRSNMSSLVGLKWEFDNWDIVKV